MIKRKTFDIILNDNIPCEITCHQCDSLVEVSMVDFGAIYKALEEAETAELVASLDAEVKCASCGWHGYEHELSSRYVGQPDGDVASESCCPECKGLALKETRDE